VRILDSESNCSKRLIFVTHQGTMKSI